MGQGQKCRRCDGTGELTQYRHVIGGVCFRCWGAGVEPYTPAEIEAWLVKARQEYKARRDALKTATGKRVAFLKAELALLETMGKRAAERLAKVQAICKRNERPKSAAIKKAGGSSIQRQPVATFQSYSDEDVSYHIYEAQDDGSLYCTCPAWKYQKKHPKARTCKHIEAFKKERYRRQQQKRAASQPEQLTLLLQ